MLGKSCSNSDVALLVADEAEAREMTVAAVGLHCFNETI
jgi:hypothetical protein